MDKQTDDRLKAASGVVQSLPPSCVQTCGRCNGSLCEPFRGEPRKYDGIRFTADGFDCSVQIAIDQHSTCSFNCLYCFSNFLSRDLEKRKQFRLGQFPIRELERFLDGGKDADDGYRVYRKAWWQGHKHPSTKREMSMPLQWGALGEPFDDIERQQGWGLEAAQLFVKYNTPVRISTKGAHLLLSDKRYMDAISYPNFWVACSLISVDDDMLLKIDRGCPPASERLKMLAELSKRGVPTSLRFRPIIQGLSDSTKDHPYAWKELIERAAIAGVQAISMEYIFVPGAQPPHIQKRMGEIDTVIGWPMAEFYKKSTANYGACLRSSRAWKEDITYAIYEHCKSLGIRFGISDPHFKELNDVGNCCGLPDDPADTHYECFGGWSRANATNAVVEAKRAYEAGNTRHRTLGTKYIPDWAWDHPMTDMCMMTKASQAMKIFHWSWGDKLQQTWNDLRTARGPLGYFEGVLMPAKVNADGHILWKYVPYERRNLPGSGWDLNEGYPGAKKLPAIQIPKAWNKTHKTELGKEVGNK